MIYERYLKRRLRSIDHDFWFTMILPSPGPCLRPPDSDLLAQAPRRRPSAPGLLTQAIYPSAVSQAPCPRPPGPGHLAQAPWPRPPSPGPWPWPWPCGTSPLAQASWQYAPGCGAIYLEQFLRIPQQFLTVLSREEALMKRWMRKRKMAPFSVAKRLRREMAESDSEEGVEEEWETTT